MARAKFEYVNNFTNNTIEEAVKKLENVVSYYISNNDEYYVLVTESGIFFSKRLMSIYSEIEIKEMENSKYTIYACNESFCKMVSENGYLVFNPGNKENGNKMFKNLYSMNLNADEKLEWLKSYAIKLIMNNTIIYMI